jgi:hypothetical protein
MTVYTLWQLPNQRIGNYPSAASAKAVCMGLIADLPPVPTNTNLVLMLENDDDQRSLL